MYPDSLISYQFCWTSPFSDKLVNCLFIDSSSCHSFTDTPNVPQYLALWVTVKHFGITKFFIWYIIHSCINTLDLQHPNPINYDTTSQIQTILASSSGAQMSSGSSTADQRQRIQLRYQYHLCLRARSDQCTRPETLKAQWFHIPPQMPMPQPHQEEADGEYSNLRRCTSRSHFGEIQNARIEQLLRKQWTNSRWYLSIWVRAVDARRMIQATHSKR